MEQANAIILEAFPAPWTCQTGCEDYESIAVLADANGRPFAQISTSGLLLSASALGRLIVSAVSRQEVE